MKKLYILLLVSFWACVLAGCATQDVGKVQDPTLAAEYRSDAPNSGPQGPSFALLPPADGDVLDDSAFDEASPISEDPVADPFEPWNRMWFAFNDFMYMEIFKPIYKGYEAITTEEIRSGLSNALRNLQAPIRIVNSILQLEFAQAVVEFGRFFVNTTVGGLGLAEIVKPEDALVPINLASADFGGTLSKWGFGEGFYLVWPIIGPSTLRDTVGLAGDTAASPTFWGTQPIGPVSQYAGYGVSGGLRFNEFGSLLRGYEMLTKSAVEPYTSMRDAYVKLRRGAVLPSRITW